MSFSEKCKRLRMAKGMTQEELARAVGVSLKTISRYESGETMPRYRKVYDQLAEVLDTSYDYLVTEEDNFVMDIRENFGSKDARDAKELVDGVIGLMAGGELPDEDKKVILDAIQEAYYYAKQENKKYIPKKYRKD